MDVLFVDNFIVFQVYVVEFVGIYVVLEDQIMIFFVKYDFFWVYFFVVRCGDFRDVG